MMTLTKKDNIPKFHQKLEHFVFLFIFSFQIYLKHSEDLFKI